jgi:hypothetical protein
MLEDRDVVVNLSTVALGDALSNPHNVATLLLLEFHKGIEDTKVELVQEGQLVQFHLWTETGVVYRWQWPESGLSHNPPYVWQALQETCAHLMLKEPVLQGLVSRIAACTLEEQLVLLAREA